MKILNPFITKLWSEKKLNFLLFFFFSTIFSFCKHDQTNTLIKYPELNCNPVTDSYFGQEIIDKYRILEDLNNAKVQKWLQEERNFSDSILESIPNRGKIQKEIENSVYTSNIKSELPRLADNKIFFMRNYLKEQVQKLYLKDSISSVEIELFSTSSVKREKSDLFNIDYFQPSYDGKFLVIGLSNNGDENTTIFVLDVEKKLILPDRIERVMGGNPNWINNKNGFFYQQFKEAKTTLDLETKYEDSKVKLHIIGTDSKYDKEVFSRTNNTSLPISKTDFPLIYTFPNSDKIIGVINHGAQAYAELYYTSQKDILNSVNTIKTAWKKLCVFEEKVKNFALIGDNLFLATYSKNPNGIVERRNINKPEEKIILFSGDSNIVKDMIQTQNALYVSITSNGLDKLKRIDIKNFDIKDVKIPYSGSIDLKPSWEVSPCYLHCKDLFFGLTSWNTEWAIYYYNDLKSEVEKTDLRPKSIYGNNKDIVIEESQVLSYDGKMIPLSIIYSKKAILNGKSPTLLYAYGAYGISITSTFDPSIFPWLQAGGIYAVAHVRGGGEKGENWYKDGYKETKPNSWKDFISCAEYLIKNNYTSASNLAAEGESAGSITIGRAITERPDLFKAAIISVGVPNTVRLEKTSNTVNVSEFGTVTNPKEFKYLFEMDTYHHIVPKINYPSVLFTAGFNDARVDIWQPAKAVAALQDVCKGQKNVILFKLSDNGHFGDDDYALELTNKFSFLFWQLGNSISQH